MQARNTLMREFKNVLDIADEQCIDIELATALHSQMGYKGDPLWIVLTGPSGCGKTQLSWEPFRASNIALSIDRFTPNTLHTGFSGGKDLLPQLNGKLVLMKDMVSVVNQRQDTAREILNQLRQIYDGELVSHWGSEKSSRHTTARFNMLGCMTTQAFETMHQIDGALGERLVPVSLRFDRRGIVSKVFDNVGHEAAVNTALQLAVSNFLGHSDELSRYFDKLYFPRYVKRIIDANARFAMKLRTTVLRNYRDEPVSTPIIEVSGRFSSALFTLIRALACVYEHDTITDMEMQTAQRLCYDQVPFMRMFIIELMQQQDNWTVAAIVDKYRMATNLVDRALRELWMLGLLDMKRVKGQNIYTQTEELYGALCFTGILHGGLVRDNTALADVKHAMQQMIEY